MDTGGDRSAATSDTIDMNQSPPQVPPVPDLALSLFRERRAPAPALASQVRTWFAELAPRLAAAMTSGPDAAAALRALHVAYLQVLAALPETSPDAAAPDIVGP